MSVCLCHKYTRGSSMCLLGSFGEGWFFAVSQSLPEHNSGGGGGFNCHCFPEVQGLREVHIVHPFVEANIFLMPCCLSLTVLLSPAWLSVSSTPGIIPPGSLHLLIPLPRVLHPKDPPAALLHIFTQVLPFPGDLPAHIAHLPSLLYFSS